MVNRVLLIAFHFPPVSVSSGLQRTLAYSQYLSDFGWQPIVLSANSRAYTATNNDQMRDLPPDLIVKRAFALDTSRHLAIKGRYFQSLAIPDRWASWLIGGVLAGLQLIRKYKPNVLWATYPIATAHIIGLILSRLTGLPLIADFRDSMIDDSYPRSKTIRKVHSRVEKWVIRGCHTAVFTTQGTQKMYQLRYPEIPKERFKVIPNGYNEDIISEIEQEAGQDMASDTGPALLLHSGVIYPDERDPESFFSAIHELKTSNAITAGRLRIILRATGHDSIYNQRIKQLDIDDIVKLMPVVRYRKALKEMMESDGLMIFQGKSCNHQIPAKAYEYLRIGRPILALTDPQGDTASLLKDAGNTIIAKLDDVNSIKSGVLHMLKRIESREESAADKRVVEKYSRQRLTGSLAELFSEVAYDQNPQT